MFEERNQVRVLAGRSLGVGRVLVQNAVIGRGVRVHLDTLLAIEAAVRTTGSREGDGVSLAMTSLDRRPSGNTASDDTSHGGGGAESGV